MHPGKNGMYLDVVKNQPHLRRFCLHAQARNHPLTHMGRSAIIPRESAQLGVAMMEAKEVDSRMIMRARNVLCLVMALMMAGFRLPGGGDAQLEG